MKKVLFLLLFLSVQAGAQGFHPIDEDGASPSSSSSSTASHTQVSEKKNAAATGDNGKAQSEENVTATESSEKAGAAQSGTEISGVVRVVRGFPVTEVFFRDRKESYFIDPTSSHDRIMNACLQSSRTGQSVSLRVDPVSRHVYSLSEKDKASPDQSSDSAKSSHGGAD